MTEYRGLNARLGRARRRDDTGTVPATSSAEGGGTGGPAEGPGEEELFQDPFGGREPSDR